MPASSVLPDVPQMSTIDVRERLIVALDVADADSARSMIEDLGGVATFFKIGLTLQLAPGIGELIAWIIQSGRKVFLDYKYYDIDETLRKAVGRAAGLGVSFLTVHGSSGLIRAAVEGRGKSDMKLFTVTVLTSMDIDDIREMGYTNHSVEQLVLSRAKMALNAGCDGVIASGHEARQIKELTHGKLLVATPGIRESAAKQDDQKRRMTPRDAILRGADYLVIGRPITEPKDTTPRKAAERILTDMQGAFDSVGDSV